MTSQEREIAQLKIKLQIAEDRVSGLISWAAHNGKRMTSSDIIRAGQGVEYIRQRAEKLSQAGARLAAEIREAPTQYPEKALQLWDEANQ